MKYVLAYQLEGTTTIDCYPIPKGQEDAFDKYITEQVKKTGEVTLKSGLKLKEDEIKGPFTEADFERFKDAFFAPAPKLGPGYEDWLKMGAKLKKRESLEEWKKKPASSVEESLSEQMALTETSSA